MTTVWVIYKDIGYEGCTPPLAVFDDKRLADIFIAGAEANYGRSLDCKEMELNDLGDKP